MLNNKVLIVEDDEVTAAYLQMLLEKQGYTISSIVEDATSAKMHINTHAQDIVIIDISLQDSYDGIMLAHYVRQEQPMPFIFLTAYDDDKMIKNASKTEPYGYLIKPLNPETLHVTIQMALHKYDKEIKRDETISDLQNHNLKLKELIFGRQVENKRMLSFGNGYRFDIDNCEILYREEKIELTNKEKLFIKILIANIGLVISFKELVDFVWEGKNTHENSVRTLVWRLRSKLQTNTIQSASGLGYYIEALN